MARLYLISMCLLHSTAYATAGQECAFPISAGAGIQYKDTVAVTLDIDATVEAGTEDRHIPLNLAGDYTTLCLSQGDSDRRENYRCHYGIGFAGANEWGLILKYDNITNKWILSSRTFSGYHDYCRGLAKDECTTEYHNVCMLRNSTCDQIPWKTVAVCESGCPPPFNSTSTEPPLNLGSIEGGWWPQSGSFPAKWRILAPAGNSVEIVESNIVEGDGSCCKRKPDICDNATCKGVPFLGCLGSDKNDCCRSELESPYCWKNEIVNRCDHSASEARNDAWESTVVV